MAKITKKGELVEKYERPLEAFINHFPITESCMRCKSEFTLDLEDIIVPNKPYFDDWYSYNCPACGEEESDTFHPEWKNIGWKEYKKLYGSPKQEPQRKRRWWEL